MRRIAFSKSTQQGVVLIEAMVAILIFSLGVLAVAGLQASMIKNTSDSKYRADASYYAQQMIGQMWSDPSNILTYVASTPLPQLPNGTLSVIQNAPGEFEVVVTWQQPGEAQHNFTVTANIHSATGA
jgi:type IV pilus assembly protein PilV